MIKLSIITICYNDPGIEETCKSIVNQTWQDFEWIVIDGGSGESTQRIFDKYKYRINKFVSEKDNGIYDAYNKGLKLIEGEYVCFMNAGDSFHSEETLSCCQQFLNSDNKVVYGTIERHYDEKQEPEVKVFPHEVSYEYLIVNNICTQAVFVHNEMYKKYGLFNTDYKICADYEKWVQYLSEGIKFKYIPVIVANYDMNGISSSKETIILHQNERKEIQLKYLSEDFVNRVEAEYYKNIKIKYSFLEQIFSIKNTNNKTKKIITILGIHIKIKRK